MTAPDIDPDETMKPIRFSSAERRLILDLDSLDLEMEERFRLAVVSGNGIVIPMNAYDLDQLHGEIAAVANHETNRKRQRQLDDICRRIEEILDDEFPMETD